MDKEKVSKINSLWLNFNALSISLTVYICIWEYSNHSYGPLRPFLRILVKLLCCHISLVTLVPSSVKLFTPPSFKTSSQSIAVDFTWATSSWTFNSCSSPAKVHWTVFGSRLYSRSCGRETDEFRGNSNPLLKASPKSIYLKSNDKWMRYAL